MLKRVVLELILSIVLSGTIAFAQSAMPNNPDDNTLLYFGNDKYMQCVDFQEAADTSSSLKPMLRTYHMRIVDPDNCTDYYKPYTVFTDAYPFFLIVDTNGSPICSYKGYSDENEFREFLLSADSRKAEHSYSDVVEMFNNYQKKQDNVQRFIDMVTHGRRYDLSVGYLNTWLSSDVLFGQKSQNGYSITADFRQNISKRMDIYSGLGFGHTGEVYDKTEIVENNLYLPIGTEIFISRMPWGLFCDISARLEAWESVNVKAVDIPDYEKWNTGAAGEIVIESGSFDIHLRYSHGFIPRFASPSQMGYTNSLTLGLRLRYGD